ncbi:hypothetical protein B0H16DRAFT_1462813 [Mycena metata]|uniref:Uncharacterized protein n=1 Tax=Mycena metata TaxID=1033252 RepID=A0AAD7INE9_9AGAR|nr:hypothetical protein B0H16DRAFT_1462812 [Mycena metata]KAJ7745298.1 hypothetical protein B0H16DRAFT_1462813 [Mycena metata]
MCFEFAAAQGLNFIYEGSEITQGFCQKSPFGLTDGGQMVGGPVVDKRRRADQSQFTDFANDAWGFRSMSLNLKTAQLRRTPDCRRVQGALPMICRPSAVKLYGKTGGSRNIDATGEHILPDRSIQSAILSLTASSPPSGYPSPPAAAPELWKYAEDGEVEPCPWPCDELSFNEEEKQWQQKPKAVYGEGVDKSSGRQVSKAFGNTGWRTKGSAVFGVTAAKGSMRADV